MRIEHLRFFFFVFLLLLFCAACRFPTELNPNFSATNEILIFDADKNLLQRIPGLAGIPLDMEFLSESELVVSIGGGGLTVVNWKTGETSPPFGPSDVQDVDFVAGRTIHNLQPYYLTVSDKEDAVRLLDEKGRQIGSISVPQGTRSVQYLENGNLLVVNQTQNRLFEQSPAGEIIWESTVYLHHPYDAVQTPHETYIIADFDNLRLLEIDRQNRILAEIRGLDHPRRLQYLPDGNLLAADSDKRRIVVYQSPNLLVPFVTGLNRPFSLACHPAEKILAAGVEAFFQPTPDDMLTHPLGVRMQTILIGLGGTIVLIVLFRGGFGRSSRTEEYTQAFLLKGKNFLDAAHQHLLALGLICFIAAAVFLAWKWPISGGILAGAGAACVVSARCRRKYWDWKSVEEIELEDADFSHDEYERNRIIQRPILFGFGLLFVLWTFLIIQLRPLCWWTLTPWVIAPWICVFSMTKRSRERIDPSDPFWLSFIILIAAVFRFYRIDEIPCGLWLDETFSFWTALHEYGKHSLAPFRTTPLFYNSSFDIPNLYLVMQVLGAKMFGSSFLLIKCFSLAPSLGIVLGVYCLGKWAWGSWAGRLGALLLAVNSWQVTIGRWGWLQQWYVLAAIFALAFFIRAQRWKCPRSAAVAGVCLGFGFYTYVPILITTAAIALLYIISFIESERRMYGKLMLVCGVHLILVFAPLWNFYLNAPGIFLSRADHVSLAQEIFQQDSFSPLKENILKYGCMLHVEGDDNPRHTIPKKPLLEPLTGGFFLAGLLLLLMRFYRPAERTILLTLLIALAGGVLSLSREAPNSFRTGVFGPLVCLTAGLPLASLLHVRQSVSDERRPRTWILVLAGALLCSITVWNAHRFFVQYPSKETWGGTFGAVQHLMHSHLTPDDLGFDRLFIHPALNNLTFNVYTYFLEEKANRSEADINNRRYRICDVKEESPSLSPGRSIFIMPADYEEFLRERFEQIDVESLKNPYGEAQAILARIHTPNPSSPQQHRQEP
ncbi:MAG: glycosyltransferase family 39 protein [Candidatus Omnitrophica bacterium]|nr:glycosyltransferase family 39 protein [Candidatus Omnitrophota bacterium]